MKRRLGLAAVGSCGIVSLVGGVSLVSIGSTASAAPVAPHDFAYTGAAQTYAVPAGICAVTVTLQGASGGNADASPGNPGLGGTTSARVTFEPTATLSVLVGGKGTDGVEVDGSSMPATPGGFNGGGDGGGAAVPNAFNEAGGSGGGATSVLAGTTMLAVAGGGGGVGAYPEQGESDGGNGGHPAGAPGLDGTHGSAGLGGTQTAGGLAGDSEVSGSGQDGSSGDGGNGAGDATHNGGGGGGGGGYFGGGGGGAIMSGHGQASGGGGGSSFGPATGTFGVADAIGNGTASITYDPTTDACAVPVTTVTTAAPPAAAQAVQATPAFTG